MQKNFLIFGGIAALVGLILFTTASAGKKLLINFQSLKIGGNILQPKIQITLGLQNPSNQNFTFNSIVGTVYINNAFVGNINTFTKKFIRANSQESIILDLQLNLLSSITTIINLIKNKELKTVKARVEGNANVNGIVVPFNENITL